MLERLFIFLGHMGCTSNSSVSADRPAAVLHAAVLHALTDAALQALLDALEEDAGEYEDSRFHRLLRRRTRYHAKRRFMAALHAALYREADSRQEGTASRDFVLPVLTLEQMRAAINDVLEMLEDVEGQSHHHQSAYAFLLALLNVQAAQLRCGRHELKRVAKQVS